VQAAKKQEEPVFLPVLWVAPRQAVDLGIRNLWKGVDDLIMTPIKKLELQARVEILLRARHLSRQNAILNRQLEIDLANAGKVQAAFLPGTELGLPGFEVAGRCIPAREVGGDFYDWQEPAPGILTLTLADVMGKGMAAALLMATVRATLRALALVSSPGSVLRVAHSALAAELDRSGSFVTLFHGRLDVVTGRLTYVDAGHGYAFMCRANGEVEEFSIRGLPLGVLPHEYYKEGMVTFDSGDALILHSDGLVDAQRNRMLTPQLVADSLKGAASAKEMVERMVALADLTVVPPDDLTVLVLRCSD
jgi:phosphoserine phosphatase RsbU/P